MQPEIYVSIVNIGTCCLLEGRFLIYSEKYEINFSVHTKISILQWSVNEITVIFDFLSYHIINFYTYNDPNHNPAFFRLFFFEAVFLVE